jgi:riboflavin kinase/FMN adenylyltransferase
VTNLGVRPTFIAQAAEGEEQVPVISETHILDQKIDLYGRTLEVRFVARLREERKFSGLEALRNQIETDVQEARKALGLG